MLKLIQVIIHSIAMITLMLVRERMVLPRLMQMQMVVPKC